MIKTKVFLKAAKCAMFIALLAWVVALLPFKLAIPDPLKYGTGDFDIYDLHFYGEGENNPVKDTNIVLVEIGNSRRQIAGQLLLLNSLNPAVIGIDAIFENTHEDPSADSLLDEIINETANIVSSSVIDFEKDTVIHSFFIGKNLRERTGFINITDSPTVRTFIPFQKYHLDTLTSFPAKVAQYFASQKLNILRKRNNKKEVINYNGMLSLFNNYSANDFNYYTKTGQLAEKIRGKIVLLGFFDQQKPPRFLEDLHYTPYNQNLTGKGIPDTYGIVIHANIIAMLLSENYIHMVSQTGAFIFATVFIFIMLLIEISFEPKTWHARFLIKLLKAAVLALVIYFLLLFFDYCKIKTPLTPLILSLVLLGIFEKHFKKYIKGETKFLPDILKYFSIKKKNK